MLQREYAEILRLFVDCEVAFVVVGAYALAAHGFPRSTADIDIWVEPSEVNAEKTFRAVAEFGAPLAGRDPALFAEPRMVFQIGVAPCRIDILTGISGDIPFSEARAHAAMTRIGDLEVPILSIDHLIANKLATGRPRDLEDVAKLRHARRDR